MLKIPDTDEMPDLVSVARFGLETDSFDSSTGQGALQQIRAAASRATSKAEDAAQALGRDGELTPVGLSKALARVGKAALATLDQAVAELSPRARDERGRLERLLHIAPAAAGASPMTTLILQTLMDLPADERGEVIHAAASEGDELTMRAILSAPKWLQRELADSVVAPASGDLSLSGFVRDAFARAQDPATFEALRDLEDATSRTENALATARQVISAVCQLPPATEPQVIVPATMQTP